MALRVQLLVERRMTDMSRQEASLLRLYGHYDPGVVAAFAAQSEVMFYGIIKYVKKL